MILLTCQKLETEADEDDTDINFKELQDNISQASGLLGQLIGNFCRTSSNILPHPI